MTSAPSAAAAALGPHPDLPVPDHIAHLARAAIERLADLERHAQFAFADGDSGAGGIAARRIDAQPLGLRAFDNRLAIHPHRGLAARAHDVAVEARGRRVW